MHVHQKNTMKKLKSFTFFLLFSFALQAQSKLIVYSENNEKFTANIFNENNVKKGSNFFEFNDINAKSVVLKIKLKNSLELNKKIYFNNSKQEVYAVSNENGNYKIRYRGSYHFKEKMPSFFKKSKTTHKTRVKSKSLIPLNNLLHALKKTKNEKEKIQLIIKELNLGMFNCRQLNYLFTKLKYDSSKLKVFKGVNHNCIDINNYSVLLDSLKNKNTQKAFTSIVYSVK